MITLIALPTIWLVNRSEDGAGSARPNVAAAGLAPGNADAAAPASERRSEDFDPMGTATAAYAAPRTAETRPKPEIAIGTTPDRHVGTAMATYRSNMYASRCLYNGLPAGRDITVINVANGRSITCTTDYLADGDDDDLVMQTSVFQRLADLVAAPVHVEIRT